ncbi:hypothetical protein [Arachidicoccus terrestris]|uniref:hypothetical protein n=1 Tax=Arachidicoccus terrestris TaxID=2875539 RepID=UPI001CC48A6B|nr:hypothetical protein [Arachidicoccus terrestris]UAY55938.1 hypothetical protein K9M52_02575 [Arachidicoccus terrestris]
MFSIFNKLDKDDYLVKSKLITPKELKMNSTHRFPFEGRDSLGSEFKNIIEELFVPYNISKLKFQLNRLYESEAIYHFEDIEILDNPERIEVHFDSNSYAGASFDLFPKAKERLIGSPSFRQIMFDLHNRAIFDNKPKWFTQAFPDIQLWISRNGIPIEELWGTSEEIAIKKGFMDNSGEPTIKGHKSIIDYCRKRTRKKLECGLPFI